MTVEPIPPDDAKGRSSDVRIVAKGGGLQAAGQIANRFLGFAFVALVVRVLGTAEYGVYRQIYQVLSVAALIGAAGFPYAAVRFITRARVQRDHAGATGAARTTVRGAALLSGFICVLLIVGARQLASAFADSPADIDHLASLIRLGAAYPFLYAVMQVLRWATQAYKTMLPSVIVGNILQPLVRLVLAIGAVALGFGTAGAVTSLLIGTAVAAVAAAYYLRRLRSPEERIARPRSDVGAIIRFTVPQTGVALLSTGTLGLGVILVGLLGTDRDVGLFAIAQSLQLAGNLALTSVVSIWAPMVVDLHERGENARLESLYQTVNRWLATFAFPIFAMLIVEPSFFVRLLAGENGEGAAPVVVVLALGNLVFVGSGPCSYLLSMTGHAGLNFLNSLSAVVMYIGLGIWLVPIYGAIGIAIVDAVVTVLVNSARLLEVRFLLGIKPFGRSFAKPVVGSLAVTGVLFAFKAFPGDNALVTLAGLAVAMATYLVLLRSMGMDPEERDVYSAIKQRLRRRLGGRSAEVRA
jgi:O-antigen/teichoic acid export membrane protein